MKNKKDKSPYKDYEKDIPPHDGYTLENAKNEIDELDWLGNKRAAKFILEKGSDNLAGIDFYIGDEKQRIEKQNSGPGPKLKLNLDEQRETLDRYHKKKEEYPDRNEGEIMEMLKDDWEGEKNANVSEVEKKEKSYSRWTITTRKIRQYLGKG